MRNAAFYGGSIVIVPAEALLVSIEVKSTLDATEVISILKSAAKLRRLRPFKEKLSTFRRGGIAAEGRARYFHCVFAYDSDLSTSGWLFAEMERFHRLAGEIRIPCSVVDRVYIANRGLLNVGEAAGVKERPNDGTSLLQFYMHILNFLSQENARREPVPYIEYARKMCAGWKRFHALISSQSSQ